MPKKRRLYRPKHPFDSYPFEAFLFGSWQAVELIRIEEGTMTMHLLDTHYAINRGPFSDLRIRSRKATLSDCSFLRPGMDVCVLEKSQCSDNSDGNNPKPVWLDAKISSIERKPHESVCSCPFYLNFYVKQGSLGSEIRTISKDVKVVRIDQIAILQKLERNPCEDQPYRWASSENCCALTESKLLLGKFLSDLSWLLVASVLRQVAFNVRSVEKKIGYQILGADSDSSSSCTDNNFSSVSFSLDNGMLVPTVARFGQTDNNEVHSAQASDEVEQSPGNEPMNLRRSKRRYIQPDRYLGTSDVSELQVGFVRTRPYKIDPWKDDDMSLPLSCLFGKRPKFSAEHIEGEQRVNNINSCRELLVYNGKSKSKKVKSSAADKKEHQNQLAIVPLPDESEPIALEPYHLHTKSTVSFENGSRELSSKGYRNDIPKQPRKRVDLITFENYHLHAKVSDPDNYLEEPISSRSYYNYVSPKVQRTNSHDLEDMGFENRWEGKHSSKTVPRKSYHSVSSRKISIGEQRSYKDRSLSAGAYKELIDSFLKNIDTASTKEEPPITDQWEQFKAKSMEQKKEMKEPEKEEEEEDDEESSELEMLWREMELSLASSYIMEDTEGSNDATFAETVQKSSGLCQHEYRMDEEIGIFCCKCGVVSTEIKDIAPPFMQHSWWHSEEKRSNGEDSENKPDEDEGLDLFSSHGSPDTLLSEENENVWALIPQLRRKLHIHQKRAFEFLWKNVAGSLVPALMEAESKKRGGCVVSHSPGAGKTFLIIAFLVSYLKLFPGKRPLVLAPKTTLYTWYKEFIKWEIPIPVHLIHGRRTYRAFKQNSMVFPGVPKPTDDVKHILDCLEKIQKWHAHPSVLVMGYTSFLTLMREDSKFAHRKYMAKVLRESPGILILDEGHNPRSTKSRLRKGLMKVETDLRILLSGTLFQNNFCEYFNTLCLARPKFIHQVLKELDPKYKRKKKGTQKARHLMEARARKFFLDNIAKKIDSDIGEERMQGLNMLRNITNGFIDVYEGGSGDSLPGLQIYTLLMNTADIQHEMLEKLQKIMGEYNGYPLELELMITLGSIHPWLVKTAVCANKFFTTEELMKLEKYKFDIKKGSKVRFVLSLVYRIVKKEKVLIFCHNIAPIRLFLELFEKFFGWQKGREVLVLTGDLELFDRGRVMDQFEEAGGASRVLLASITACAEGISLTAASRVIMLDSEWNPSKTKQAIARAFRPGQVRMVYVYQLLATGTLEEDKYRRTTWKEWVSSMIFSEAFVEDPSRWQAEKIEDDILREMVAEDRSKSFHMIMKNEKASKS
ncbi:SNF2 domain-containing protein CLASSY [Quillaja saponaria]|uniref:SNF2 domain-containing protein CLASSY n=1 Tax=Quillaja saponaria TaxID=32244 RepID=A0AAD7LV26_QUISA|nr:SNF2 domain-containing protein CLASSY [Quillaja saponaria]KAJ7963917.1 SNF2 domain-containing protein CLASSY [Quillaja saponaria]